MTMLNIFRVRLYKIMGYLFMVDFHKIADFFVWMIIIGTLSLAGYFVFDSLYPRKLLVFDYPVIPIAREFTGSQDTIQAFSPGDTLPLRLKGERYTNKTPIIITHLINVADGSVVASSSSEQTGNAMVSLPRTGKGKFNFVSRSQVVPFSCTGGTFYFERIYKYERNFIRNDEQYKIRTESFRVVVPVHNDETDEALIRRILKEMHIIGEKGQKGDKGDTGKRGPNLFGK